MVTTSSVVDYAPKVNSKGFAASGITDWLKVLVSVEEPPTHMLKKLDRSERHNLLCENATRRRKAILNWIDEQDLESEFKRVGAPTLFGTISMVCTPHGAQLLKQAPGVTRVVAAPDLVWSRDSE